MHYWIEAMRLRTLPVSIAGVIAAVALAIGDGRFRWPTALLCLAFAVMAQIASNFANEYYDYKAGLDRPGREGPRRGVTEGDISPWAMKRATYAMLAAACACGLALCYWGGFWLVAVGALIALGVLAYSTGPYPLSHHALGEVAVVFFFGIIPVVFTYYLQTDTVTLAALVLSLAMGLMGANVLVVNNYRDRADDAAVGKVTIAVRWGATAALMIYFLNGIAAAALIAWVGSLTGHDWCWGLAAGYFALHLVLALQIKRRLGAALNPMLGLTAMLMFIASLGLLAVFL